jgi:hypothetical protein
MHPKHGLIPAVAGLMLLAGCSRSAEVEVAWDRYYSTAETHRIMRDWAGRRPDLVRLVTVGRTRAGTELLVAVVTAFATGPDSDKPALYVDGNLHSGELTGSAVTLYLMGRLVEGYGRDPRLTRLLETRAFYLRPKFNPDGADLALLQDISLRSTPRPVDDDADGQADEDPAEDLNGDGFITEMRIPDEHGNYRPDSEEPRLMVRRSPGETTGPFYRVVSEGIDNDRDGRLNEDGIGGLDLNRNFPRNWEPEYLQPGAGPFPLSEPESWATLAFIDAHPNITGIVHGHTSGGFLYRLPSATDPARFDPRDIALVLDLGSRYTELTGRPVEPSSTDPVRHRYGTLISWAYWDRGIVGWVPEYWPGLEADIDGDGRTSERERLRYVDRELGGRYFVDWQPFEHPEFGRVEIGGWRSRLVSQNPPPELLEAECALQIPWIVELAERSPRLTTDGARLRDLGEGRWEVTVTVTNEGYLPTHLTVRGLEARLITPVYAELELEGASLLEGVRRTSLGHLAGAYPLPGTGLERSGSVRWVVRADEPGAGLRIKIRSEKGGSIDLGPLPLGG